MMYHRKLTVSVSSHFVHSLSFLQYEGNIVRVNMSRVIKERMAYRALAGNESWEKRTSVVKMGKIYNAERCTYGK